MNRLSWTSVLLATTLIVGCRSAEARAATTSPPSYNPYPPGILPADLEAETQRVRREVQLLFQQALAEATALPPSVVTGQPPRERGSGYRAIQILGKLMNYDENISAARNVACASCHMPYAGFGGPIPSVNLTMVAYPGTYHVRAGSGSPSGTPIRRGSRCSSTIPSRAHSSAETSGIRGRRDTACRIPMPSRPRDRPSTRRRWASPTPPASLSAYCGRTTGSSSSGCGARGRSTSHFRPTPRRSARRPEGPPHR